MEIIFAYDALNRGPSASRLTVRLLGVEPVQPYSGETIAAAMLPIPPADLVRTDAQTLPTTEGVAVVTGSAVFRSSPGTGESVAAAGIAVVQEVEPAGIVGIALFGSPVSFVPPYELLALVVQIVGSQSA